MGLDGACWIEGSRRIVGWLVLQIPQLLAVLGPLWEIASGLGDSTDEVVALPHDSGPASQQLCRASRQRRVRLRLVENGSEHDPFLGQIVKSVQNVG